MVIKANNDPLSVFLCFWSLFKLLLLGYLWGVLWTNFTSSNCSKRQTAKLQLKEWYVSEEAVHSLSIFSTQGNNARETANEASVGVQFNHDSFPPFSDQRGLSTRLLSRNLMQLLSRSGLQPQNRAYKRPAILSFRKCTWCDSERDKNCIELRDKHRLRKRGLRGRKTKFFRDLKILPGIGRLAKFSRETRSNENKISGRRFLITLMVLLDHATLLKLSFSVTIWDKEICEHSNKSTVFGIQVCSVWFV